jgi:hypothetical protein
MNRMALSKHEDEGRYSEGVMRTFGFAIGVGLLILSAPYPSAAQPPVKIVSELVKSHPRFWYEVGEGWKINPPIEYSIGQFGGGVSKLPTFGAMWKGLVGTTGGALGVAWGCEHVELCVKKK